MKLYDSPEQLKAELEHYATYLAPAREDDNNYYRGECPLDGKDAAGIGDMAEDALAYITELEARPPFGDAEVERLARWMYQQEYEDTPFDLLTPGSRRTWRAGASRRLNAAFGIEEAQP